MIKLGVPLAATVQKMLADGAEAELAELLKAAEGLHSAGAEGVEDEATRARGGAAAKAAAAAARRGLVALRGVHWSAIPEDKIAARSIFRRGSGCTSSASARRSGPRSTCSCARSSARTRARPRNRRRGARARRVTRRPIPAVARGLRRRRVAARGRTRSRPTLIGPARAANLGIVLAKLYKGVAASARAHRAARDDGLDEPRRLIGAALRGALDAEATGALAEIVPDATEAAALLQRAEAAVAGPPRRGGAGRALARARARGGSSRRPNASSSRAPWCRGCAPSAARARARVRRARVRRAVPARRGAVARARHAAVGEVLGSDRLVRVVEFFLALGNHMNGHARSVAAAPSAAGVKLSSAARRAESARATRAVDRAAVAAGAAADGAAAAAGGEARGGGAAAARPAARMTALEFGVDLIVRRGEGDALSFLDEMPTLARAAKLPDAKTLEAELAALRHDVRLAENELRAESSHWAAMDARRARRAAEAEAAAAEAEAARASVRMRAAEAARARQRARARPRPRPRASRGARSSSARADGRGGRARLRAARDALPLRRLLLEPRRRARGLAAPDPAAAAAAARRGEGARRRRRPATDAAARAARVPRAKGGRERAERAATARRGGRRRGRRGGRARGRRRARRDAASRSPRQLVRVVLRRAGRPAWSAWAAAAVRAIDGSPPTQHARARELPPAAARARGARRARRRGGSTPPARPFCSASIMPHRRRSGSTPPGSARSAPDTLVAKRPCVDAGASSSTSLAETAARAKAWASQVETRIRAPEAAPEPQLAIAAPAARASTPAPERAARGQDERGASAFESRRARRRRFPRDELGRASGTVGGDSAAGRAARRRAWRADGGVAGQGGGKRQQRSRRGGGRCRRGVRRATRTTPRRRRSDARSRVRRAPRRSRRRELASRADAALDAASEASTRLAEYFGEDLPKAHAPSAASPGAGAPSAAPAGGMSALRVAARARQAPHDRARALEARRSATEAARGRAGDSTTGPEHAPAVGALRVGERVTTAFGRGVIEAIARMTPSWCCASTDSARAARAFFQPSAPRRPRRVAASSLITFVLEEGGQPGRRRGAGLATAACLTSRRKRQSPCAMSKVNTAQSAVSAHFAQHAAVSASAEAKRSAPPPL